MATEEPRYRLLPGVRTARLGSHFFVYDENARFAPVVFVPTQRVRKKVYDLVRAIRKANPENEAWPLERIRDLFEDPKDRESVDVLVRAGYLDAATTRAAGDTTRECSPSDRGEEADLREESTRGSLDREEATRVFATREVLHFFRPISFFNLPTAIDDGEVDVGLLGIPFASVPQSSGTAFGPDYLRAVSQRMGFWFDICRDGFFSELALEDQFPPVLCKNIVAKDYGNLGPGIRRVGDLMAAVRMIVDEKVVGGGIRPVFVGGDHAVTFPIVDAFIRHHPDLVLVHFDAHNDLFYTESVVYNHGSTILNLLVCSGIQDVYSLGLRTHFDSRVGNVNRVRDNPEFKDRVHHYSIGTLKRILSERERLRGLFERIGSDRPCYISIDLDVLSPVEISRQVSTPCGPGLEWWELFEIIRLATEMLHVVGADIVELNPPNKKGGEEPELNLAVLLLLLIDGVARTRGD